MHDAVDPAQQLAVKKIETDTLGYEHTTLQQVHEGVPVFAGLLRVHRDVERQITAVNGTFIPNIKLDPTPVLSTDQAAAVALAEVGRQLEKDTELRAINKTLYEDMGYTHLPLTTGIPTPCASLGYVLENKKGNCVGLLPSTPSRPVLTSQTRILPFCSRVMARLRSAE